MHCRQVADGTKQNTGTVDRVRADKSRPVEGEPRMPELSRVAS